MAIDLDAVVNSISEGLYIVDTERRIVYWSRGAEKITGWKAGEVIGSHCEDGILEHVDFSGHTLCHSDFCPLARSIRTGESLRVPSIVYSLSRKKRRIPVEVTTAPWRDARGGIIGGIEVFRDMSFAVAEMQAARTIQLNAMAGLPQASDSISFEITYHPHDLVGGDFYRVEKTGGARWSFLLADVTSHGVSAALFTLLLRSLWDQSRELLVSPAAFAARMNSRLIQSGSSVGYFTSGLAGVVDTERMTLSFCSMGSPPFFQIGPRTGPVVHEFAGPLLGVEETNAYEEHAIPLARGDRLLFVTDGVFEVESAVAPGDVAAPGGAVAPGDVAAPGGAVAPGGTVSEQFGIERLRDRVSRFAPNMSLEAFSAEIEKDLLDFSGRLQLPDDFSALLVRIN